MTFKVIDGGGGKGGPRKFRENRLVEYLWRAVYPRHATSMEHIRQRLCKLTHERITAAQTDTAVAHLRKHAGEYGWTINHVEKGADGNDRKYFPVLVDADDPDIIVMDEDKRIAVAAGIHSSLTTTKTMCGNEAVSLEATIPYVASKTDRRYIRAVSSMLTNVEMTIERYVREA